MKSSNSEFEARIQRCVEYRQTPGSSLVGWQEIMEEEYNLSIHQANRDFGKAGEIIKQAKEEERKVYLASIEAQLDVVYELLDDDFGLSIIGTDHYTFLRDSDIKRAQLIGKGNVGVNKLT